MRRNLSWAFVGNVVYAASQWGVLIILTKLLPLEAVGEFAFGLAVAAPLFMLANARLRNLLVTGVETTGGFGDYFCARLLTSLLTVLACCTFAAVLPFGRSGKAVLCLMALAKACDALSDICHAYFQRELNLRVGSAGLMLNGLSSLVLVSIVAAWSDSAVAVAVAYLGGSVFALSVWDIPMVRRSQPGLGFSGATGRLPAIVHLIRRGLPLGISTALGSLHTNIPRYFIVLYLGSAPVGVFSALAYVPLLGGLIINAISQSVLPILSDEFRLRRTAYWHRLRLLVTFGFALGVGGLVLSMTAGEQVLMLAYTPKYARHADLLVWLVLGASISYAFVFLGTGATARHRFKAQLTISLVSTGTLLLVAGPLIQSHGLRGAALAMIVASLVDAGGYVVLTAHDYARHPKAKVAPAFAP